MTLPIQLIKPTRARAWLASLAVAAALLSLGLLLFGVPGSTGAKAAQTTGDHLLEASRAAGVKVHAEEVFTVSRGDETVTLAPIAGWEGVPATALPNGVEFAFAHFSTRTPNVPRGYYRLRAIADARGVGTVEGRVQLIDSAGRVAAELPAQVEVHSMTVPEGADTRRSFMIGATDGRRQIIWARCPNGQCIRIVVLEPRDIGPIIIH